MFVNQEMKLCANVSSENSIQVWIENGKGSMTMTGSIELL